mgnify:FL=1
MNPGKGVRDQTRFVALDAPDVMPLDIEILQLFHLF